MLRNFPKDKEIQISVVTKLDIKKKQKQKKNYASILRGNKAYKKKTKAKKQKQENKTQMGN